MSPDVAFFNYVDKMLAFFDHLLTLGWHVQLFHNWKSVETYNPINVWVNLLSFMCRVLYKHTYWFLLTFSTAEWLQV